MSLEIDAAFLTEELTVNLTEVIGVDLTAVTITYC